MMALGHCLGHVFFFLSCHSSLPPSSSFPPPPQVRFDDTNPTKERDEYVDAIVADIARLGLKYDKITYTSDYFPQMLECAQRMIK